MAKILFVSGWYPTDDKPSLGIFVRRHAEAAALNNEVSVLYVRTISAQDRRAFDIETGTKNNLFEVIISINKSKLLFPPVSFLLKTIFYIYALIKGYNTIVSHSGKPGLVHANILYEGGRQALFLKFIFGIPYVCTEHWTGYLPEDGSYKGYFKKLFSHLIAMKALFILPVTKHLAGAMQSHRLKGNYHVVPNAVNHKIFYPDNTAAKNKNQIVHVSSLDERQKNPGGILTAFREVSREHNALKLIVAGGESNIASVSNLIEQLGIDRQKIIFKGNLDERNLARLLSESAFLLLFSNFENQPCVILEALACGIPVIATDVGGISEVVHENNGILIQAGNENDLASAIKKIIEAENRFSAQLLSDFVMDTFSYEKINSMLNEVYKEALRN